MLTRRQAVKAGLLAGGGLFIPWKGNVLRALAVPVLPPGSPAVTKFADQLFILPVITTAVLGTNGLQIAPSSHRFHSQLGPATTWGYGGASYLGPTIEATKGSAVTYTATNSLGAHPLAGSLDFNLLGALTNDATAPRVSLHLHGGNTAPASDGEPTDTFTPSQTHQYNYTNNQEATTLWYHDHALGITRLNVCAGLAGFYLLRDANELNLGLPSGQDSFGGSFEVPLAIQDRTFNADGSLFYPPKPWAPEFFGDVAVVNGVAWPNLNVDKGVYRFRILNASNARFYNLSLSSKQPIYQIGTDGGFLNAPVPLAELLIGPGERADVLIDFSGNRQGEKIVVTNNAPSPFPSGRPRARAGGFPLPEVMQFTVGANAGFPVTKPGGASLLTAPLRPSPIPPLPVPTAVPGVQGPVRNLTLVEILGPLGPLVVLLNYLYFEEPIIDNTLMERPTVDTVEQWNLINLTADAHPIHLHLVQFQILNRQKLNTTQYLKAYTATGPRTVISPNPAGGPTVPAGYPPLDPTPYVTGPARPPAPNEAGWKDTVRANPGEVTRILVPFGAGGSLAGKVPFGNSFTGRYVWHCHILEHEDNEMMLPYEVVP